MLISEKYKEDVDLLLRIGHCTSILELVYFSLTVPTVGLSQCPLEHIQLVKKFGSASGRALEE